MRRGIIGALIDRFVLTVDNVTGVWLFLLRLFGPGDLQSLYVLERLGPGRWGYYSLTGVREGLLARRGDRASYVNRSMSIYRHITPAGGSENPVLALGLRPSALCPCGSGQDYRM